MCMHIDNILDGHNCPEGEIPSVKNTVYYIPKSSDSNYEVSFGNKNYVDSAIDSKYNF
jgi:hypothetical protein